MKSILYAVHNGHESCFARWIITQHVRNKQQMVVNIFIISQIGQFSVADNEKDSLDNGSKTRSNISLYIVKGSNNVWCEL